MACFFFFIFFGRSITNYVFLLSDFKSRDDPNVKMNLLSMWVGKSMHVDNTSANQKIALFLHLTLLRILHEWRAMKIYVFSNLCLNLVCHV